MSPSLPVTLASVITAAFSAGGGLWLANPGNKALVLNKLDYVHAKIDELEAKLGTEHSKLKSKASALVGKTVKNEDGHKDLKEAHGQDPRILIAAITLLVVLVASIIFFLRWKKQHDAQITGHLWVKPLKGIKLKDMDTDTADKADVTDAFVDVHLGNQNHQTKVVKDSLNPDFSKQDSMRFEVNAKSAKPEDKVVRFEVKDYDGVFHTSELVGHAEVEMSTFVKSGVKGLHKTVPLLDSTGKKGAGSLEFEGKYVPVASRDLKDPLKKEVGCSSKCSVM